jgi:diacylglycerol kinase (ATP)
MSANPQKHRTGLNRIWHAFGYSLSGLKAAWHEKAFRQEAIGSFVLIPLAFYVGQTWQETALLAGTASAIDRIGPEWHELAKRAKDTGSAAVLLSLLLCIAVWAAAIHAHFFA